MNENAILVQNGMNYVENYLSHFGKGHDDNPPGRGSGRYPWGSGQKNEDKKKYARKNPLIPFSKMKLTHKGKKEYDYKKNVKYFNKFQEIFIAKELRARGPMALPRQREKVLRYLKKHPRKLAAFMNFNKWVNETSKDLGYDAPDPRWVVDPEKYGNWLIKQVLKDSDYIKHSEDMDDDYEETIGFIQNGMDYVDNYIAHYGRSKLDGAPIGSGRFHLGSGKDSYQDYPDMRAAKKEVRAEKKAQKAEDKKQKTKQQLQDKKFKLLREGDISKILKEQELFSNEELNDALNRSKSIKALNDLMPKKVGAVGKFFNQIDKASDFTKRASGWINNGIKLYSSVQNVYNLKEKATKDAVDKGKKIVEETLKDIKPNKQEKQETKQNESENKSETKQNNTVTHPETGKSGRSSFINNTSPIFRDLEDKPLWWSDAL